MNNIGKMDQAIRIILGLAVLRLFFVGKSKFWGILGLIPLLTGTFSLFPLYDLFGIKVVSKESEI